MSEAADKSDIAVRRLGTVLVLHDLIAYPEIEIAYLQICFLRLRIDQFPDHLIELVNRSRAGRAERREDLHTVYAVLPYLRQIDIPYMLSGFLLPGTLTDGKIVAVEKAGVVVVDLLRVIGDKAVFFLTENLIEYRHRD